MVGLFGFGSSERGTTRLDVSSLKREKDVHVDL